MHETPYRPIDAEKGVEDREDWGLSVNEQLTAILSKAIREQIDKELLEDLMVECASQDANGVITANVNVRLPKPVNYIEFDLTL